MMQKIDIVLAAAGKSRRMGNVGVNKPYLSLDGKPVLAHNLDFFEALPWVGRVVVVASPAEVAYCQREVVDRFLFKKVFAVVPGGEERQDSIYQGLKALASSSPKTTWVAVHDSARPFLHQELFTELFHQVQQHHAVVPGVLVKDTMKQVDAAGWVEKTLPRQELRAIQTPQVFYLPALLQAYQKAVQEGFRATDDAMLYEKYVGKVHVVDTNWNNVKITTPEDWEWAQYCVQRRRKEDRYANWTGL